MKILLLGSGGREHALAWKMAQSSILDELYIAPGNSGTRKHGKNVAIDPNNFPAVKDFVLENNIELVVVGPEEPLVNGIADYFNSEPMLSEVSLIGPDAEGAQLEGSKDFAKAFMKRHNIPTAKYGTFTKDSIEKGEKILVIDDLIATGGTAEAAAKLIEISGGQVAQFIFVINLFDLPGNNLLKKKCNLTMT